MKLVEVEGRHVPHSWRRHCLQGAPYNLPWWWWWWW